MAHQEELSLIDLVIVLVRRRWIIISMTTAALVLAVAYFYIAPALRLSSRYSYTVSTAFLPLQFPPSIKDEMGIDLPKYAQAIALSPSTLIGPVWAMKLDDTKLMTGPDDPSYLTFLRDGFLGRKIFTCVINENGTLQLFIKSKDRKIAETFLKTMVETVDMRLQQEVAKRARVIAESMMTLLADSEKKGLSVSMESKQILLASSTFAGADISLLQEVSGIETSREFAGRPKGAVITVLAGFCLSLLVAFLAEAIANVKNDEASMKRIRDALSHGKKA